ncbi:MAG: NAD(P)H-binding protein [Fibrella sp.]|nr:NAD(P)H-binding protein [Armatimonadota bacterium]
MRVFVTGATGFVGRGAVSALHDAGHEIVGLVRRATPSPYDNVRYVVGSVTDDPAETLAGLMEGCDAVIHLVGIIAEVASKNQTFERVHVFGTANVVDAAKMAGAGMTRFVYVSAIGAAPDARAEYSRTKATAENLVRQSGLPWTVFRPSLVFAAGAPFLKQMEELLRKPPLSPFPLPFVPVPGDGQNRFQPVHRDDLAVCLSACPGKPDTANRLFEIGGSDEVTFDELLAQIGKRIGVNKPNLHAPIPIMYTVAAVLESVLPHPPITTDQLLNLEQDNVCDNDPIKRAFDIYPLSLTQILDRCYDPQ